MTNARQRLRRAASDFAEALYDLLRGDVADGPSVLSLLSRVAPNDGKPAAPTSRAAAEHATPRQSRARSVSVEAREAAVAFVRANPGVGPGEILSTGLATHSTLFRALSAAVSAGQLTKHGSAPRARYYPTDAREALTPAPPKQRVSAAAATDELIAKVAAFVAAHPACGFKEIRTAIPYTERALELALKAARQRDLVRLEGVRFTARYFPPPAADSAPDTPAPQAAREAVAAPAGSRPPPEALPSVEPPSPPSLPERATTPTTPTPSSDARRAALPADVEALLNELELSLADDMHDVRLGAVLQAIVADIRLLQPRFDDQPATRQRLDGMIRRITAIRAERGLGYINGLKRDADANWALVARDARRRVSAFDADAGVLAPKVPGPRAPKAKDTPSTRDDTEQPLPALMAMSENKAIVLVGGIKKNEVLEQARARHGLSVEWAAMQGGNARAADYLLERIRHGRVGAVVILEGLADSTQVRAVVDACEAGSVPFAYGGRAGGEQLRGALTQLDGAVGAAG